MAQSLENKFNSNGSGLGYPVSPASPGPNGSSLTAARLSTQHKEYSYIGDPNMLAVQPRYDNAGGASGPTALPSPTELQPGNGPQNDRAAGAGFNTYGANSTYDDFILAQGGADIVNRLRDNLL